MDQEFQDQEETLETNEDVTPLSDDEQVQWDDDSDTTDDWYEYWDTQDDDSDDIKISKDEYDSMKKKIQKLQYQKKKAIKSKSQERKSYADVGEDEVIDRRVNQILQQRDDEKLLSDQYPDLDIKKVKSFAKNKWLSLLQAYGALQTPLKMRPRNMPTGSAVQRDWFSSSAVSDFLKRKIKN